MRVKEASGGNTLKGMVVLVTRPEQKMQPLCDAIEAHGGKAIKFPLLQISAVTQPDDTQLLRDRIQDLDRYDILIFISSNAAVHGAELINSYWSQFPIGLKVIAIGPSTAQTVSSLLGCEVIYSERGMTSEDVLKLPDLVDVDGKRIAIFRGKGGRELLASTLLLRNASIDYFEVYYRSAVQYAEDTLGKILSSTHFNAVIVTSGESLAGLLSLAGDNKQQLRLIPLIVPSARISEQAQAAGFATVFNANGADETSLLATLQDLAAGADKSIN